MIQPDANIASKGRLEISAFNDIVWLFLKIALCNNIKNIKLFFIENTENWISNKYEDY